MAYLTSTAVVSGGEPGTIHSLAASESEGHRVPGSGPGTFFYVFRVLGDPSVICMVPPVGLGMAPVVYPLKPNFPSFSAWSRPRSGEVDLSEVRPEEATPIVYSSEEVMYERKNRPVFARFRR